MLDRMANERGRPTIPPLGTGAKRAAFSLSGTPSGPALPSRPRLPSRKPEWSVEAPFWGSQPGKSTSWKLLEGQVVRPRPPHRRIAASSVPVREKVASLPSLGQDALPFRRREGTCRTDPRAGHGRVGRRATGAEASAGHASASSPPAASGRPIPRGSTSGLRSRSRAGR